jgi:hypothetical protein
LELADGKTPTASLTGEKLFLKMQRRDDVDFFRRIYRQEYRGIQTQTAKQGRVANTSEITDGFTDGIFPSMMPSVNASIYCLYRHSLFLSSFVSPSSSPSSSPSHLSPPKLQPTTHLNSPIFSTQASTQVSYTFVRGHNIH